MVYQTEVIPMILSDLQAS